MVISRRVFKGMIGGILGKAILIECGALKALRNCPVQGSNGLRDVLTDTSLCRKLRSWHKVIERLEHYQYARNARLGNPFLSSFLYNASQVKSDVLQVNYWTSQHEIRMFRSSVAVSSSTINWNGRQFCRFQWVFVAHVDSIDQVVSYKKSVVSLPK